MSNASSFLHSQLKQTPILFWKLRRPQLLETVQATLGGGGIAAIIVRAGTIFSAPPPYGWEPHHVKIIGWDVKCLSLPHKEVRREAQIISTL